MLDDRDLDHLEDIIDQARQKLVKTAGYLSSDLSRSLKDLIDHVDDFRAEVSESVVEDDAEDEAQ